MSTEGLLEGKIAWQLEGADAAGWPGGVGT